MSYIANYIEQKNNSGEKILSVFLTAGVPDKNNFVRLAVDVLNSGADLLEIGFPFSDPLAEGPVIQKSSFKALQDGINLDIIFDYVKKIKEQTDKPILLMGYANTVLKYGMKNFADKAKESGTNGVIIPDVPIDEYDDFFDGDFEELDTVLLITPTSPPERVKLIDKKSRGFVYCVSVRGTTGMRKFDNANLDFIKNTYKLVSKNKMLVGFGISDEETAKNYAPYCDGVIVGSAVVNSLLNSNGDYSQTLDLVKRIKSALL